MCGKIKIFAPAKLNLFLYVLGKREDGYHDLFSLFVPVTLFDEIEIEVEEHLTPNIELIVSGKEPVPEGEGNLICRAAKRFLEVTKKSLNVRVRLHKRIPVAAGLGGGSSDAASTLLALNEILGRPCHWKTLYSIGRSIGADVPALLTRGPCLVTGIGDIFTPISGLPEMWFVIVCPEVSVSTAQVYGSFKRELTTLCIPYINGTVLKDIKRLCGCLKNDLEPVTLEMYPKIRDIKGLLLEAGAEASLMSGSGASVFGIFGKEPGEGVIDFFRSRGFNRVYTTKLFRNRDWGVVKR